MSSICPICFETFNGKIKASPDVCNHIFCLQCLQTWTKTDNVCPIDRKKFRKIINLESATTILIKPQKRRRKRVFYDISTYCEVCKGSSNGDTLLLCDCCDLGYHCSCLNPPITVIPNDRWHCPECVAVELRLRTNKATNADRRFAKNRRNRKKEKVSKSRNKVFTRKLRIHYSETRHIQIRPLPVSASPGSPEQFESSHPQYGDQPGPSCSSTSAREDTSHSLEDEFEIGDSDFADSSSDYSELDDDISRVMDYFHQQEELNNTATFGEEGHLEFGDEDEFQDYDFDVFSSSENENGEAMKFNQLDDSKTFDIKLFPPVLSEPCTTATSTCENKSLDMESNDTFDFGDSDFNSSSSENCESKVGDVKVPRGNSTKYKIAEDGCYLAPSGTSQNEIHGVKQPEDYLQAKHNSTVNHTNSLTPKIDFIKSLKKTTDLIGTINGCNISSSVESRTEIDDVIKFKESLLAKQNNPSVNDFNLSSPKREFMNSLNKARDFSKTIDGFNILSSENYKGKVGDTKVPRENSTKYKFAENGCYLAPSETSQNGMRGIKQPEDYLHAKHNSTLNNFNSLTPKIDFVKSLKKTTNLTGTIDGCNISSSAKTEIDDVIKFKESLLSKQNNPSVNSSSPKKDFLNSLKEAREKKRAKEGCNISSSENSQNGIQGLIESVERLHAEQNNPTVNDFNSSSPKTDFMNSLSKARDLNKIIDGCNISSSENSENRMDGAIESEERLHAKQNNQTVNDFNSSSPKRDFMNSLSKARDLNKIIDGCNISSSENSENRIDGAIESEERLHAKQNNRTVNDFNSSSPKRDFMNSLSKPRDLNKTKDGCNSSSSKNSENRIDGAIESEESLYAKQKNQTVNDFYASSTKQDVMNSLNKDLNKTIEGCNILSSENSENRTDGVVESEISLNVKQNNSTVNDFNSSPKRNFKMGVKKARNLKRTVDDKIESDEILHAKHNPNIKHLSSSSSEKEIGKSVLEKARSKFKTSFTNVKDTSSKKREENSTNEAVITNNQQVKRKTFDNDLNSSPKRNFKTSAKKARRNLKRTLDDVKESDESLHAKHNPNIKHLSSSSSEKEIGKSVLEKARSKFKASFTNVKDTSSKKREENSTNEAVITNNQQVKRKTFDNDLNSSPKRNFKTSAKKARRNLKRTLFDVKESDESLHAKHNPNIKHFSSSSSEKEAMKSVLEKAKSKFKALFTNFNDTSMQEENSTNEAVITYNQQVKRKTFDNVEPDLVLNTCITATSTFENDASDFNISPLEIRGTEMDDGKTCKENLHLNEKNEDIYNCNPSSSENNESTDVCSSFDTASSKSNESVSFSKHSTDVCNSSNSSAPIESETMDDYISTKNLHPNKTIDYCNASSSKNNEVTDECFSSNILPSRDNGSIDNCNFLDASSSKRTIDYCNSSTTSPSKKRKHIDEYISADNVHLNECNNAIDKCNISSSENCQNKMDEVKSKKRLHAKEQNRIQNYIASSSSASNKNVSGDKIKDGLCPKLQDNDDNCTSSMDCSYSDYHKAILLKLPLRLSFKRSPKTCDDHGLTTDTSSSNATVDDISASICKIASVTSLQQLDSGTASCSDDSLLSNIATIRTDQVLQTQNSTNKNKQNEIDGSGDMTPSISIPITFSLIEEQNEPFQTIDTGFFNCAEGGSFIENPWSNFYSRQASSVARDTTTAGQSLKHLNEEQVKTPIEISPTKKLIKSETSPTKKLIKNDYTLGMEKSGNLTLPSNASHLFGNRIFIKDMKQLSVRKDGALFLNWKNS